MLTALIQEARIWPAVWRRRFVFYWRTGEKETLVFLAGLALVFAVLGWKGSSR
jgi:hypothetical protein